MIHTIIVDDEPLAREVIKLHLAHFSHWLLLAECSNAMEAYEVLVNNSVDLVFLDIQMPRVSGVDFLRSLKLPPKVIFTTAHADYAVEGFALDAVDYLLKPITLERFTQALGKAEHHLNYAADARQEQATPATEPAGEHIFVKQDNRLVKVLFSEILYLEARRDFTMIYLREKKLMAGFHLKMLEEMLPAKLFMRVHRSFIVRLGAIEALTGNIIEMRGLQVPVSNANRAALAKALGI